MWTRGAIGGYTYWIKHYEAGSEYGIDEGRISKMTIRKDGKELFNFDLGLDFDRLDAEGRNVYAVLIEKYN